MKVQLRGLGLRTDTTRLSKTAQEKQVSALQPNCLIRRIKEKEIALKSRKAEEMNQEK